MLANASLVGHGIGFEGWTQEVSPGNASAISLAGNNMMFLRGDGAVFGKGRYGWAHGRKRPAQARLRQSRSGKMA
jgi:hypothetical protein